MIENLQAYFTFEVIYIWANIGVLPFWIILTIFPRSNFNQFFVNSILIPLILAVTYTYILYQMIVIDYNFFDTFDLYFGLDNLYALFSDERYLLIFWIHFLALSLFLGSWISKDAVKYNIPRWLVGIPIIITYFTGPVGLVLYWFIRIFFSKKIGLHD